MKQTNDIMEAFSAEIKDREIRYRAFNLPLAEELYLLAQEALPALKTCPPEKKKELYMRAFFRAGELSNFMMERIYDDENDEHVDIHTLAVPRREESEENDNNRFLYDCFDLAKKKLWISFPEMSEFSGNSILHMNRFAYECMTRFRENVKDVASN